MRTTAARKLMMFALLAGLLMAAGHEYSESARQVATRSSAAVREDEEGGSVAIGEKKTIQRDERVATRPAGVEPRQAIQAREEAAGRARWKSTVAEPTEHPGHPARLPWTSEALPNGGASPSVGRMANPSTRIGPPSLRAVVAEDDSDRPTASQETGTHPSEELPPLQVPFSLIDPGRPATIPAALGAGDAEGALWPKGATEKAHLAATFVAQVAEGSDDPRDPAYQQRWMEAQEESDTRMRASLGGHAWLRHHRDAHRGAMEDQRQGDTRTVTGVEENSPAQ